MLTLLHESHMGIAKTKARANESMYWPKIKYDIEYMCLKCQTCNKFKRKNQKEPLKQYVVPERPFQRVGVDIFEYKNKDYVLCVDYYSKFIEIRKLCSKTAKSVQKALLAIFAVHGIPEEMIADNMPFNSRDFKSFARETHFRIITTSPTLSQANGMAERSIQTVKRMLKKANEDGIDESYVCYSIGTRQ